MGLNPLDAVADLGGKLLDKFWPDAGEAERQKVQLMLATFAAQADIVKGEAQSEHWLAACWRPITMLVFVGLIVARWFGWAAPNLDNAEYIKLWDIVQIGLNGYVIGRTVEKVAPTIASAMGAR